MKSETPRFSSGHPLGRYEILDFLGAGAISEVYRARDNRLGRTVALKLVSDPDDHEAGARLLVEARHTSTLNHPNICGVHEAKSDDELPFIVLELVEGPTLFDILQKRQPSAGEVLEWGKGIAAALDHAHGRGIIHRDLKSANVALSVDGNVKVLDFGLSRRVIGGQERSPAEILTNASVERTLTHIAPEVLRGSPIDHRVDLWALGVLLYELVTGHLPFKQSTVEDTANAILDCAPEPMPSTVPIDLRRVIERCMAKDPALRVSTAAEVRAALDAVRVGNSGWHRLSKYAAIATLVVAMGVTTWLASRRTSATALRLPSIAVVPFENSSGDSAQRFYADGVTEELIALLGRIDGIRVIAAGTARRYGNSGKTPRDFVRAVGVGGIVEGSIEKVGDEIRLTARLLESSTGRVLWTERYRRDAREVHALHATVAKAVARVAQIEVNAEDARHFATVRAVDPNVYEAYLKGRYYWNQRTPDSLRTAVTYFQQAIQLDPSYAPAYASLADSYNLLGTVMVAGGSPREWRPKAMETAIKALQIDAELSEAHATLGYVRHYNWQWIEAEKSLRHAIALNPNNALARIWYSNLLCSLRRFDEAVQQVLIARDVDPLSLIVSSNVGWVYYRARRNSEAITEYERGLTLDPTYLQSHMRLADAYLMAGRFDDAIAESETVARLSNRSVADQMQLERTKLLAGRPNEFNRRLEELIALSTKGYASPAAIANAYFSVGRNDEGFVWLQRAYDERTNNMAYLAVEPVYDNVRDDPRFRTLLRAIGLP